MSTNQVHSAIRRDVNLSSTFDGRYCESPFLLQDDSTGGRDSQLSAHEEDISDDLLFGTTLGNNSHSSLRDEVITPTVEDSARGTTPLSNLCVFEPVCILSTHIKQEKMDEDDEEVLDDLGGEVDGLMLRDVSRTHIVSPRPFKHSDSGLGSLSPLRSSQDLAPLPDSTIGPGGPASPASPDADIMISCSLNGSTPTSSLTGGDTLSSTTVTLTNGTGGGGTLCGSNAAILNVNPSAINSTVVNAGTTSAAATVPLAGPPTAINQSPMDIKILPSGLIQLAANLAAVFPPSNGVQKQIAIQLLREDGTSIIVPITTRRTTVTPSAAGTVTSSTSNGGSLTIKTEPGLLGNVLTTTTGGLTVTQRVAAGGTDAGVMAANSKALNGSSTTAQATSNAVDADRPFKCELCNSTFTRLGNYTRHKKIHSLPSKQQEDQRFRCDICNKSFIQRCDLARHLHIHRGTEPHRCPQCGKGYIRHSDLVTHQRFHNKEKPFACPHCSKGFCQRGDLNRHLRSIHLQLKPLLCSLCNRKFAKEETLLRHVNATHRDKTSTNGATTTTTAGPGLQQPLQKQAQPTVTAATTTTTTVANHLVTNALIN